MSNPASILVYGSYGYTGQLIVAECAAKKIEVLLSGRDSAKLKAQSEKSGYPYEVLDLKDADKLKALLQKVKAIIHCAGPFRYTARTVAEACLETGTHYIDITGEHQVFELLPQYHQQAVERQIQIMPGAGFDVVPTDCLALHLKNKLPDATHLQLAFASLKGGLSRGTAKTMAEGAGTGSLVRRNGKLEKVPLGKLVMNVDFGAFQTVCLNIPWGDISTAWRTTGIPNIEVYTGAKPSMIRNARISNYIGWFLQMPWVKRMAQRQIDSRPPGPTEERRKKGRSYLWGKVWNAVGDSREARMETLDGYTLTARTAVLIAEKVLRGEFKSGYQTPAGAYGESLILEVATTTLTDQ
jgi:short subunit dehydrogenase-like uncharacterized protein